MPCNTGTRLAGPGTRVRHTEHGVGCGSPARWYGSGVDTSADRPQFTPREREVLDELVRGRTNFEIAQRLGISLDGVKWHIREILSKLDVASREEAAGYWSAQRGWRRAARGARRGVAVLFGLRTGAAVVSVLGIGVVAVGAWLILGNGSETAAPEPARPDSVAALAATATPGVLPTTPPATPWADGEQIPFTCDASYPARRPTLAEIKARSPLWVRFTGPDGQLAPGLFGMSLSSVYYNSDPFASSARIEPAAFFASIPVSGAVEVRCKEEPGEHIIALRDYRPVSLWKSGVGALLLVEADPGTRHEVAFEPRTGADPKGGVSPIMLPAVAVLDRAGSAFTGFANYANGAHWEWSQDGQLLYATGPNYTAGSFTVPLGGGAQRLRFLAGGPGIDRLDVEALSATGAFSVSFALPAGAQAWDDIAVLEIPAGTLAIKVSGPGGDAPGVLILAASAEVPPRAGRQ
jgi:DNA-binding CsgD family transcriptional regulator